jgi:hypothetical protein
VARIGLSKLQDISGGRVVAGAGCFAAAVSAVAVAWIVSTNFATPAAVTASDMIEASPAAPPIAFAQRFPTSAELQSTAAASEIQIREARDKLARDMGAQTQPAVDDSRSAEVAPVEKTPLPRARPLASKLMADYGAAGSDPKPSSPLDRFDVRSALQNVFAMLQPPGLKLASAAPDGGVAGDGRDIPPAVAAYGKQTAVYDISARVVYMPDGTRLEAHSGLGELIDDPQHIAVHDRGPTPPNVYELTLREKPFHGVQALRLKPVGDGNLFGRSGLLAHSYLMGPGGDSNGCVSFKDYNAFLQAFSRGDVKRLVVVKGIPIEAPSEAGKA